MKIGGNFFGWNSPDEFLKLYNDEDPNQWEYVEGKGKPGTLISPTLRKFWYKDLNDCKHLKYVVAYNRFNGNGTYDYSLQWPKVFEGEKLIFNDVTDKIFCYPTYLIYCNIHKGWTYLKKNLSRNDEYRRWREKKNRRDWPPYNDLFKNEPDLIRSMMDYDYLYDHSLNKVLFPAPENPPAGNIKAVLKHNITWKPFKDRKYDVFFAGQTRAGYMVGDKTEGINKLKEAVKKLKLKALIIDKSQNIGRKGYMEAINNTKFCFNFSIGPLRNRREWEILLGGGLLVQDSRTKNVERDIMFEGSHFIWQKDNLEQQLNFLLADQKRMEEIAYQGWSLAKECWLKIPTLEFRLFMEYMSGGSRTRLIPVPPGLVFGKSALTSS